MPPSEILVPHNNAAEQMVLGALASQPTLIKSCALCPEDFYSSDHAEYYAVISEMAEEGTPIDLVTLLPELGEAGAAKVSEYVSMVPSTANFAYYHDLVKELGQKRRLQRILYENAVKIEEKALRDAVQDVGMALEDIRNNGRRNGITGDVEKWVSVSDGTFSVSEIYGALKAVSKAEKATVRSVVCRLLKEGVIQKEGTRASVYRRIDMNLDKIDWINAPTNDLPILWPFAIEKLVKIYPGNIITVAGEQNAGKTFFLLEFTRINMNLLPKQIHYFSSEMRETEFKVRIELFQNTKPKEWNFFPWARDSNFADVIRPNEINIIDYLELNTDFWKIAETMLQVHQKLKEGIAIIALQKSPGKGLGRGGDFGLEKPRLYLTIEPGKIKIVKGKNWRSKENPNGLSKEFKLIQGWNLMETSQWDKED